MTKIIMIIVLLALVILVHEWGHFIAARLVGVKVNEFAIGMGPKLWSTKRKDTLYSIRMLPIGGFCSMEGETGEVQDVYAPDSMLSKKPWQRFVIFAAGAVMNFVLALLFIILVVSFIGYGTNVVESIETNMPAYNVLQVGDKIVTVDGVKIIERKDITKVLEQNKKEYIVQIERLGQGTIKTTLNAKWSKEEGRERFGFSTQTEHFNIFRNITDGVKTTGLIIKQTFTGFVKLITGKVKADQLAGIVGVAQISSDAWNTGMKESVWAAIMNLIYIGGIISANLGVLNLLPLPALDGGRIFFTLIEMLRGKPMDPEKEGMVHFVGFVLLMALMVFVLYNDVMRIIK